MSQLAHMHRTLLQTRCLPTLRTIFVKRLYTTEKPTEQKPEPIEKPVKIDPFAAPVKSVEKKTIDPFAELKPFDPSPWEGKEQFKEHGEPDRPILTQDDNERERQLRKYIAEQALNDKEDKPFPTWMVRFYVIVAGGLVLFILFGIANTKYQEIKHGPLPEVPNISQYNRQRTARLMEEKTQNENQKVI